MDQSTGQTSTQDRSFTSMQGFRASGIVDARRDGKTVFYRLNDGGRHLLDELAGARAARAVHDESATLPPALR